MTSHEQSSELRFTEAYLNERSFLLNAVRRLGVPPADVEDAVHDVFVVLHAKLDRIQQDVGLRRWLSAVAVRICSNRRRGLARRARRIVASVEALDDVGDARQALPDECSVHNE